MSKTMCKTLQNTRGQRTFLPSLSASVEKFPIFFKFDSSITKTMVCTIPHTVAEQLVTAHDLVRKNTVCRIYLVCAACVDFFFLKQ